MVWILAIIQDKTCLKLIQAVDVGGTLLEMEGCSARINQSTLESVDRIAERVAKDPTVSWSSSAASIESPYCHIMSGTEGISMRNRWELRDNPIKSFRSFSNSFARK
jgi:hypothetical protein